MIVKTPKSGIKKWFKRGVFTLIIGEGLCFIGSYFAWHKLNTERDVRKYFHDNYPAILESYYKIGETFDSKSQIRQIDLAYWSKEP